MEDSDAQIILKAQSGSLTAFEELVSRYQKRVFFFLRRYFKAVPDIEDVTQETFIAVYKNLKKVDPEKKFSTYIFEIAKNKAIFYFRKHALQQPIHEDVLIEEEEKWFRDFDAQETKIRITKALNHLSAKYQNILKLYYFENLDYKEISMSLKIPLNSVRTLLRRAKIQLKKYL